MDESGESPGYVGERLTRHRRWERFGLAAVLVVSLIGVGAAVNAKHQRDALPPVPTLPVVHVSGVTTRLVVPKRSLKSGSSMDATVVVTNSTGHPIESFKCGAPFQVNLRSRRVAPAIYFPLCAEQFSFPIGRSTYRVAVDAAYTGCTRDPRSQDRSMPDCGSDGKMPALPSGRYRAFVVGQDQVVSSADPVEIEVE